MQNLNKLLKGHKYLIFMDFEGTQFSHEMIAIAAVVATLDRNNKIKRIKEPFKRYVKAKNKVGNYVCQLTGITDDMLMKEGVIFSRAMKEFKTYCGRAFDRATFVTFGNHDLTILNQSISYTLDYPKDVTHQIQKNFFDFTILLNEFVKDEKGSALSLLKACQLFNVKEYGTHHDPVADAINLANLYDAFIRNKDIVLREYVKVLTNHNSLPMPVKKILKDIYMDKEVNIDKLERYCKEYIDD